MPIPNKEKAVIMRRGICPPGSSFDKVAAFRKSIKTALEDTELNGASVCDNYVPLEDPRSKQPNRVTEKKLSQLNDLIDQIEESPDDNLVDIGNLHDMTVI